MKLIIFFILILVNVVGMLAQSNTYNVPKKEREKDQIHNTYLLDNDLKIGLSVSKINTSSYFDLEGNTVAMFLDSNYLGQYDRLYTISLEKLSFEIFAKKKISEDFLIEVKVPVSNYSLNERYLELYDSINIQTLPKEDKANFSLFIVDYLETRGIYKFLKGQYDLDFGLTFRLPFGSENGVARNSRDFWSDNAIELLPEVKFGVNFEKFNLALKVAYNYRTEDLKDRLITSFQAGLYSIPESYISANIEWANSLTSFDNALPFEVRKEPNMENYLETNILFGLFLSDDLGVDFSYKIRLLGKNSWNYFGYKIGVFYNL